MIPLPESSAGFADATWESLAPFYRELELAPLDAATLEAWLARWSRLDELVTEAASLAMIAYTIDTADEAKKAAHLRFSTEVLPTLEEAEVALAKRFVARRDPTAPTCRPRCKRFRTAIEIFREANVPLVSEAEGLAAQYQQITGGDDGRLGRRARAAAAPGAVPEDARIARCARRRGARRICRTLPRERRAVGAVRPDGVACGRRWRTTRDSPISGITSSRRSAGSTTRRPTAQRLHDAIARAGRAGVPALAGASPAAAGPRPAATVGPGDRSVARDVAGSLSGCYRAAGDRRPDFFRGRSGARRPVPDHDRRAAARPGIEARARRRAATATRSTRAAVRSCS